METSMDDMVGKVITEELGQIKKHGGMFSPSFFILIRRAYFFRELCCLFNGINGLFRVDDTGDAAVTASAFG